MKRSLSMIAVFAVLMAGFMSVCAADENCAPEATHASSHGATDLHASKVPTQDAKQDHCGMLCHVAPHSIPQALNDVLAVFLRQGRIMSTDDTIRPGLYTVLDQPPRA